MAWWKLEPAPVREDVAIEVQGHLISPPVWQVWLSKLHAVINRLMPSVGSDIGDADVTLTWGVSAQIQVANTPLTAPHLITLSTVNAANGAHFRVVRTAAATGASGLSVGGLKTLAVGQWCDVHFDRTAWFVSAFGSV